MKFDGILFDLDGTLWDSTAQVAAAWNKALEDAGRLDALVPCYAGGLNADDVRKMCGKTMDVIRDMMFGDLADKQQLAELCFDFENEYLADGHPGAVYAGMAEVLEKLAENHPLFVVSNCQCGYIETFLDGTGLGHLFTDTLSFGETGRPKGENIRLMCERHGLKAPAYIGDTQGDADAAAFAGVPFIHAAYGFAEVSAADAVIGTPEDLLRVID